MSWKKHFTYVPKNERLEKALQTIRNQQDVSTSAGVASKYSSYLPEFYEGPPNRKERYKQYETMDQDSEIHAALNIIADFCTQTEEQNPFPFDIEFHEEASETEVEVLKTALRQWCRINKFSSKVWEIFRKTIKYGDTFFIRDPETYEWIWIDPADVEKIRVDESKGKKPVSYIIKNLDYNLLQKTGSKPVSQDETMAIAMGSSKTYSAGPMAAISTQQASSSSPFAMPAGAKADGSFESFSVDAKHVIHLSLTSGLDTNWPFGNSILESVFKTFKQKELLEDSILIYRVQRAPERRVFYIDVGNTPPSKAMAYVERIKNEIHQRRIPNKTGGGTSILDATYNPMATIEDYFFPQTADGRGSKVETLPGGDNLGEIDDLKYFNNKLIRGLGVPSSYLPTGPDDGTASYNDGRVGTAYIQEYRFGKYCERLQRILIDSFDVEFKRFCDKRGLQIETDSFMLMFNPPQNFAKYRQIEMDSAQISVFQQLSDVPYLSKRFVLKRFLDLSEDEILENERMWAEENAEDVENEAGITPHEYTGSSNVGMSAVGIPGGDDLGDFGGDDMDFDTEGMEPGGDEGPDLDLGGEEPEME